MMGWKRREGSAKVEEYGSNLYNFQFDVLY
jgi:hypothetical protein